MTKYWKGNVLTENFFYALWTVDIIHVWRYRTTGLMLSVVVDDFQVNEL